MSDANFLSLGLDVGTTTTHLVISQLTLGPGEDAFGRHHVLERKIVYRSAIHLTPLLDSRTIDAERIAAIVAEEYRAAGVTTDDIRTGAVIVTGETALKSNAQAVVRQLAGQASTFAAAVAGANQEAVLAARGSGATDWSRRHGVYVLNVDIGGGTTNLAWFDAGRLLDAAAVRIGGRHLIRSADAGGGFEVASATARQVMGIERVGEDGAARWIDLCVRYCERAMMGDFGAVPEEFVVTRPHHDLPSPDVVFVSGGVGELMSRLSRGEAIEDVFGDTGLLLACALVDSPVPMRFNVRYPSEPIRATVIGAGQFATSVSGETLWIDPATLPLLNLPVLRPFRYLQEMSSVEHIAGAIRRQRHLHDLAAGDVAAVSLPCLLSADWDGVDRLAKLLVEAAAVIRLPAPWVFVMEDNLGRFLGERMCTAAPGAAVVVIDEVDTSGADFIDVGKPLESDRTIVPVVAKSLVFQ